MALGSRTLAWHAQDPGFSSQQREGGQGLGGISSLVICCGLNIYISLKIYLLKP